MEALHLQKVAITVTIFTAKIVVKNWPSDSLILIF